MNRCGSVGSFSAAAGLFAASLLLMSWSGPAFHWIFPALERPLYTRVSFFELAGWHVLLVTASTGVAAVFGVLVALLVTRRASASAKPLVLAVAAVSQTFPPIAVLAVWIPILGFGGAPTSVALFAYALLPIVLNAVTGLETVTPGVLESADAMGMTAGQRLAKVELPLAAPAVLTGIRTAAIINVGTATVGSTAGAFTLGSPIIDGLSTYNTAYVIQGAVLVALLAIVVDQAFDALATGAFRRTVARPERLRYPASNPP